MTRARTVVGCANREIDKYNLQMRFDTKKNATKYFHANEAHVAGRIIISTSNIAILRAELYTYDIGNNLGIETIA